MDETFTESMVESYILNVKKEAMWTRQSLSSGLDVSFKIEKQNVG